MNLVREARALLSEARALGLTLALAESCTGGMVSESLTAVPGSSDVFQGAVVSYSNGAKRGILGVSEATLREHGAVSAPCVVEMAIGASKALDSDCAIAISGVAGPGGGTRDKPVGTVYIAWLAGGQPQAERYSLKGTRAAIRRKATALALRGMRDMLASQKANPGSTSAAVAAAGSADATAHFKRLFQKSDEF